MIIIIALKQSYHAITTVLYITLTWKSSCGSSVSLFCFISTYSSSLSLDGKGSLTSVSTVSNRLADMSRLLMKNVLDNLEGVAVENGVVMATVAMGGAPGVPPPSGSSTPSSLELISDERSSVLFSLGVVVIESSNAL